MSGSPGSSCPTTGPEVLGLPSAAAAAAAEALERTQMLTQLKGFRKCGEEEAAGCGRGGCGGVEIVLCYPSMLIHTP